MWPRMLTEAVELSLEVANYRDVLVLYFHLGTLSRWTQLHFSTSFNLMNVLILSVFLLEEELHGCIMNSVIMLHGVSFSF